MYSRTISFTKRKAGNDVAEKKERDKSRFQKIGQVIKSNTFQRVLIGVVSLIMVLL